MHTFLHTSCGVEEEPIDSGYSDCKFYKFSIYRGLARV